MDVLQQDPHAPGHNVAENLPKISIVILNFNRAGDLRRNLEAVGSYSYPSLEIIVVDNGSTDGSCAMVRKVYPHVILIELPTNRGVCGGRNAGFRRATGEFIIYLDDDAVAPAETPHITAEIFQREPATACLGFLVRLWPDGTHCIHQSSLPDLGCYAGGGHAFRTVALREIGYLDEERFFFAAEEFDSTIALVERGYRVRYTPEVIVDHYSCVGNRLPSADRLAASCLSWSACYFKHFPWLLALYWTGWYLGAIIKNSPFALWCSIMSRVCARLPVQLKLIRRVRRPISRKTLSYFLDPQRAPAISGAPLPIWLRRFIVRCA
jgi:GT2 family glycosyltransferase